MKKELKVWAITCIAFWWLAPNQLKSQQVQDSLTVRHLDEVNVSASKFPKSSSETGKVIHVITEEEIRQRGAKDLSQLLQEVNGMYLNGAYSNFGKDKAMYIRGASAQYSLIMVDGIPVYDPSGVNGIYDLRLLSLNNVERIEILKGSQSTLYGTDAMAGTVNIITKNSEQGQFNPNASLSFGSYNEFRAGAGVSGTEGKFSYSAGYQHHRAEGFSEARNPEDSGEFEKDAFRQDAFDVKVEVSATESLQLRPFFQYTSMEGDYDNGAFSDAPDNIYSAKSLRYGVVTDLALPNGKMQVQFSRTDTDRTFDSEFGTYNYTGIFDHLEGFYLHDLGKKWQLMGGLTYQRQDMASEEVEDASMVTPYASVFFRDDKGLFFEAGGRFVHHSEYGNNATFSINPGWHISKSWKLFINYTTGFKAPSLTQLFGQFGANPDLLPEKSRSLEGGVSYISRVAGVRVSAFNRRIDDMIIYVTDYQNSDRQDVTGIELEPEIILTPRLKLTAGYTWLKGELHLKSAGATDSIFNGILRQPEHMLRGNVSYSTSGGLILRGGFQYFGSREDIYFDSNDFMNKQVALEAYTLVNAYVAYSFANQSLLLFGELRNIFDIDYYESYGYSVMGRNGTIGIKWSL